MGQTAAVSAVKLAKCKTWHHLATMKSDLIYLNFKYWTKSKLGSWEAFAPSSVGCEIHHQNQQGRAYVWFPDLLTRRKSNKNTLIRSTWLLTAWKRHMYEPRQLAGWLLKGEHDVTSQSSQTQDELIWLSFYDEPDFCLQAEKSIHVRSPHTHTHTAWSITLYQCPCQHSVVHLSVTHTAARACAFCNTQWTRPQRFRQHAGVT